MSEPEMTSVIVTAELEVEQSDGGYFGAATLALCTDCQGRDGQCLPVNRPAN